MTLSDSTLRTLRHAALALALGYCVGLVACQKPDTVVCSSGRFCPAGAECAARQDVCIFTACGNGKVDPGEVCDDGNVLDGEFDGGHCSSTCRSDESCGNGIWDEHAEVAEECDYGLDPLHCSSQCKSMICGNDQRDPGEECDPGPLGTNATCLASCRLSKHGDGFVNSLHDGEQCDGDGLGSVTPGLHGDYCAFAGTVSGAWHACNADCTPSVHGDGKVNRLDGEQCDVDSDGAPNPLPAKLCESSTCNADCTYSRCGDGIWNQSTTEQCDDGDAENNDECKNDCTSAYCGDLVPAFAATGERYEECDLGPANVETTSTETCAYGAICTFCLSRTSVRPCRNAELRGPYCGDGTRNGTADHPEACDDLNSFACGSCSGTCTRVQPTFARGAIDVQDATSIAAGDTIVIFDGSGASTLEFDAGGCQSTVNVCVSIVGLGPGDEDVAADRLRAAMSGPGWTSRVTPTATGTGTPVSLEHLDFGVDYNVTIGVHGASLALASSPAASQAAVVVDGMSGGVGCASGHFCRYDRDCASNRCLGGGGGSPGTCQ